MESHGGCALHVWIGEVIKHYRRSRRNTAPVIRPLFSDPEKLAGAAPGVEVLTSRGGVERIIARRFQSKLEFHVLMTPSARPADACPKVNPAGSQ